MQREFASLLEHKEPPMIEGSSLRVFRSSSPIISKILLLISSRDQVARIRAFIVTECVAILVRS